MSSTFGTSPAALYLFLLLEERKNKRLNRCVSKTITSFRSALNDLVDSHLKGSVSLKSFNVFLNVLSRQNHDYGTNAIKEIDPFIAGIVLNVLEGDVKVWKRRAAEEVRTGRSELRRTKDSSVLNDRIAYGVPGEKTVEDLKRRSSEYLARHGKLNTLY